MSIWSDGDIARELVSQRHLKVEGYKTEAIQPASLDLRLGHVFWRFKHPSLAQRLFGLRPIVLDPRGSSKPLMDRFEATEVILKPQGFLLGSTIERVSLGDHVIARVEGKSSLGRIGLSVHCTAGFIDPGNQDLSITMELFNQSPLPIRLCEGMWIGQLAFQFTISPCERPYGPKRGSRYFGDPEAAPSRASRTVVLHPHVS